MAGAGYKSWVDGDILTASDVNTYLMQQAVMVFADASARTSAIAAPSEGMVTYLTGTDVLEYYDGAAWQPILDQDVIEAKGDLIVGTADDTVGRLAVGANGQVLTADSAQTTGLKWATPLGTIYDSASVATQQSTTTTTYTDLATSGPAVTVTTGTKALVFLRAELQNNTIGNASHMSFAVSGASTVSASDGKALSYRPSGTNGQQLQTAGTAIYISGLTAGSNTFTAKYRAANATASFQYREITVIDLGS